MGPMHDDLSTSIDLSTRINLKLNYSALNAQMAGRPLKAGNSTYLSNRASPRSQSFAIGSHQGCSARRPCI